MFEECGYIFRCVVCVYVFVHIFLENRQRKVETCHSWLGKRNGRGCVIIRSISPRIDP